MRAFNAGRVVVDVSDPYPVTVLLYLAERPNDRLLLSHGELADLHYAVTRAMHYARARLGKDGHEVVLP